MAITAYCKKCSREVEPGEVCPRCGAKLAKTAAHAAWTVERRPVADWMSWNAVMRWLLPAALAVLLLVLGLEAVSGGTEAVERMLRGSFPKILLALLGGLILLVLLALALQGRELTDYAVDSRGVHAVRYLPDPTPVKLLARMKSPARMREVNSQAEPPLLRLDEQDLAWRQVARVQLWPEKCTILFYAPAWWMRLSVRCTPFSWEDALFFVRDKLGKKKSVSLPEHLRTGAASKSGQKPAGARTRSSGAAVPAQRTKEPAFAAKVPKALPETPESGMDSLISESDAQAITMDSLLAEPESPSFGTDSLIEESGAPDSGTDSPWPESEDPKQTDGFWA